MLTFLATMLLSGFTAGASSGSGGYSTIEDEGVPRTQRTTVNFTGAGVSCVDSGGKTVCTISGGAGGGNWTTATVTLTNGMGRATVSAAWVSGASHPICTPVLDPGTTNVNSDVVQMAMLSTGAGNLVAGVSFDIYVVSATGANGDFKFNCTGD